MPSPTARPTTALAHAPVRRPVVLVIGNDRVEIAAWIAMLRGHGFEATGAEGERASLRKAGESPPDVVVLDFRGRPSTGVAAARRIRERDGGPAAKLLVASATSRVVLAQYLAGHDAVIARPFEPGDLLRAIRGLMIEAPVAEATPFERWATA